jgi:hypothetical protein
MFQNFKISISEDTKKLLASEDDLYECVSLAHLKAWQAKWLAWKTKHLTDQTPLPENQQFVGREKIEDKFRENCAQSHRKAVEIFQEMCGCKSGNGKNGKCAAYSDVAFQVMLTSCEQIQLPNRTRWVRKISNLHLLKTKRRIN